MGKRRRRAAMHQRHLNTFYGHGALLSLQPSWHFCPILSRKNNLVGSHLHRCFGPCHPELSSPFTSPPPPPLTPHPPHPQQTNTPTVCALPSLHRHHQSSAYIKQQITKLTFPTVLSLPSLFWAEALWKLPDNKCKREKAECVCVCAWRERFYNCSQCFFKKNGELKCVLCVT